jgi:hypothetical protein
MTRHFHTEITIGTESGQASIWAVTTFHI